jgi:thiamine pyrophosphate-dependent acetolactate synthase large subunit-like protein
MATSTEDLARLGEKRAAPAAPGAPTWGSDAMADVLRESGIEYIALNPGSSYRGLHDSLVNHLGGTQPRMLVCLHEEHAVAIGHGYAKVTEAPMAVALHSNVGLMHASMALYNAFCDRVPMVVLGATGPWAADARRPWIDWIHTSADMGALVRPFVKWDDQPGSVAATVEALRRANAVTRTYPSAPVYVCLDVALQEEPCAGGAAVPIERHQPPAPPGPSQGTVDRVASLLRQARRPLILCGRVGGSLSAWDARVSLAERTGAAVITDLKTRAAFPTDHPLHVAPPGRSLRDESAAALREADVVLALDWVDLGGTLRQAYGDGPVDAQVIACTCDQVLHNGWSKDHFALPPVDLPIFAHPDLLVDDLLGVLPEDRPTRDPGARPSPRPAAGLESSAGPGPTGTVPLPQVSAALREALGDRSVSLLQLTTGWPMDGWSFRHPLDYLGGDGGGGVGAGPGISVGAAIALQETGRLPVAVLGDGDYLMGGTALWTAAQLRLPLLVVVANNGTYLNDEIHQHRVAGIRSRPAENSWVGQRIEDPRPDLAGFARSLGLRGFGPVEQGQDLPAVLREAVAAAAEGPVVVDVRIPVDLERGGGHERWRPSPGSGASARP